MPTPSLKIREKWIVLRRAWEVGFTQGILDIETESPEAAKSLRQELYRCARRSSKPRTFDHDLSEWASSCSVTTDGDKTVRVYRRTMPPAISAIKLKLGTQDEEFSEQTLLERIGLSSSCSLPTTTTTTTNQGRGEVKHEYYDR